MSTAQTPDVQMIAESADLSGWNRVQMRALDLQMDVLGIDGVTLSERQRAMVRAWLTATDVRIADVRFSGGEDPWGFVLVASEVAVLDDETLLTRYTENRRETAHGRYEVRETGHVTPGERKRAVRDFTRAAERHTGEEGTTGPLGRTYTEAAAAIADGTGFMVWDRINHMYVIGRHFADQYEALAFAQRKNAEHAEFFARDLWS